MNKKHLLLVATEFEVNELEAEMSLISEFPRVFEIWSNTQLLITGVGQYNTIFNLMQYFAKFGYPVDIINLGICGSFSHDLKPGKLVNVTSDFPASQLVEEDGTWLNWEDAGLPEVATKKVRPIGPDWAKKMSFPKVTGVTTDFITNNKETILQRKVFFKADVESMEGASVFFVAEKNSLPVVQLRSVSNYVGDRNKANWRLNEAIKRLNVFVRKELKPLIT